MNRTGFLWVLIFLTCYLAAQENPQLWNVLITEPAVTGEPSTEVTRFFVQLHHRFAAYSSHILQQEEKDAWLQRERNKERISLLKELDQLITERDQMVYSGEKSSVQDQEISQLKEQLDQLKEDLQALPPDEMNLNLLTFNEDNPLFPSDKDTWETEPQWILRSKLLHKGNSLTLEILGENALTGITTSLWTVSGETAELESWLIPADEACRETLLGREWAALTMEIDPDDAAVFRQDELLGIGNLTLYSLEPGPLQLLIYRDGYSPKEENLQLAPGEMLDLQIQLAPLSGPASLVISDPPGADLYLGSRWMGITPMEIKHPEENLSLLVRKADYQQVFLASGELPEKLEIHLEPLSHNLKERVEKSRKKFYNSLAIFGVSLAFPILMQGLQENQGTLYLKQLETYNATKSQQDFEAAERAFLQYQFSYYTYGVSLGISGVLLANSLYRLYRYIRISEQAILEE